MNKETDPVCAMTVDTTSPPAKLEYKGTRYFFCSVACKKVFQKDPERFIKPARPK